ncbi:MAG: enoyl-CoA hydratase/isomerase family protein [Ignavibacterium sp.]
MNVITQIQNHYAIIKLNRPEKRNALSPDLIKEFLDSFNESENNSEIKTIIITSEGTSFCAGADLNYLNELKNYSSVMNYSDSENLAKFYKTIYESNKITIAAVNGPAIAGGCGLATTCDFIIAHQDNAVFGYSEVKIGFIPAIVSFLLIKRIGETRAKQILISAKILSAKEALTIGLVDYLNDDPIIFATQLAEKFSNNSLNSISETKKLIKNISNLNYNEAINLSINANTIIRDSEDFKIGLKNFLTKNKKES